VSAGSGIQIRPQFAQQQFLDRCGATFQFFPERFFEKQGSGDTADLDAAFGH
jgi:hypothetical protein